MQSPLLLLIYDNLAAIFCDAFLTLCMHLLHLIPLLLLQLDLASLQQLTFKEADRVKYPCIDLAYA
jgi:1-deoxy-D-xylulose 5-phosphate reductoisomerase